MKFRLLNLTVIFSSFLTSHISEAQVYGYPCYMFSMDYMAKEQAAYQWRDDEWANCHLLNDHGTDELNWCYTEVEIVFERYMMEALDNYSECSKTCSSGGGGGWYHI